MRYDSKKEISYSPMVMASPDTAMQTATHVAIRTTLLRMWCLYDTLIPPWTISLSSQSAKSDSLCSMSSSLNGFSFMHSP